MKYIKNCPENIFERKLNPNEDFEEYYHSKSYFNKAEFTSEKFPKECLDDYFTAI